MRTNQNQKQKPCWCPICTQRRATVDRNLRNSLSNINNQFTESRKKTEEYEKTRKLLRLMKD